MEVTNCPKCGYTPKHTGWGKASGKLISVGEHEIDGAVCLAAQLTTLRAKYERAIKCLKNIEFNPSDYDYCPYCQHSPWKHEVDCELKAILAGSQETP